MARAPSRRTVAQTGEFKLITLMTEALSDCHLSPPYGIGDDAAVIRPSKNYDWLVSKDLLSEDIHFDSALVSYRDIAYKAAAVNISDMAAMGGIPVYLIVGVAVPPSLPASNIRTLYQGLNTISAKYRIKIIGGDTSASRNDVLISLTIIGKVKSQHALCRSGAKVGDNIYVSGTLGDSGAGLRLLQRTDQEQVARIPRSIQRYLIDRHLHPTPRVQLGRILAERRIASAAIDLSDGLSGDLHHLCQASHVGAVIEEHHLPISRQCATYVQHTKQLVRHLALHCGEDYELLFTAPPDQHTRLRRLATRLGQNVTRIGTIQRHRDGIHLTQHDGSCRPMTRHSYDHFHEYSESNR